MIIECAKKHPGKQPMQPNGQPKLEAGQQVNRVGKYMYKNLDGAYNIKFSPNMCDVFITLLYQLPVEDRIPEKGDEYNDVHEMTLNLNITTYQDKLRVNVIELTPEEMTLGHNAYKPEQLMNLKEAIEVIFGNVVKKVSKAYKDYDFIF